MTTLVDERACAHRRLVQRSVVTFTAERVANGRRKGRTCVAERKRGAFAIDDAGNRSKPLTLVVKVR